jgi:hypothetical protein
MADAPIGTPAYSYRAGAGAGPSCSGSPDFCFLCQYCGTKEHHVGDTNYTDEIRQLVNQLAADKKELPVIVTAVSRAYDAGAKQFIQFTFPNGAVVNNPTWSRASIERHLMFSTEFKDIFRHSIDHIYHALIVEEQSRVMLPGGGVNQQAKRSLLQTIDSYAKWMQRTGGATATASSNTLKSAR